MSSAGEPRTRVQAAAAALAVRAEGLPDGRYLYVACPGIRNYLEFGGAGTVWEITTPGAEPAGLGASGAAGPALGAEAREHAAVDADPPAAGVHPLDGNEVRSHLERRARHVHGRSDL